jgi:hypothetical protein
MQMGQIGTRRLCQTATPGQFASQSETSLSLTKYIKNACCCYMCRRWWWCGNVSSLSRSSHCETETGCYHRSIDFRPSATPLAAPAPADKGLLNAGRPAGERCCKPHVAQHIPLAHSQCKCVLCSSRGRIIIAIERLCHKLRALHQMHFK